jgi:putative membrane protein
MNKILLFLKGFLMGICDIIPGISGGTIAFITGIYEKLISSVKGFSPKFFKDLFTFKKKELKKDLKTIDFPFLITLLFGILVAIVAGSRAIKYLLENYNAFTISFFVGLILASSKIIFDNIKNHKMKNIFFGIIGLAFGISFAFLIPVEINPGFFYIFLGGFFGISAMFLPGISGAFILLIMGIYGFIIDVLHSPLESADIILVFLGGVVLGVFVISRVVSFLFEKDKCKTLYFLLGLVIGSLSIPVSRVFEQNLSSFEISLSLFFVFVGGLSVTLVNNFAKKRS